MQLDPAKSQCNSEQVDEHGNTVFPTERGTSSHPRSLPAERRSGQAEPRRLTAPEVVARWDEFKTILDARSPGEFALDHLPGACNTPVLNDLEREQVGRINAEQGAFEAKRTGAALVARNIASLIEQKFAHEPRQWNPLIYCWRGGQRSGSLATVLARIGWPVQLIEGGYKAFRQAMLEDLRQRSEALNLVVIAGRTGTAKTRLLQALQAHGAQTLDLESLAQHRGSVLGQWPVAAEQSVRDQASHAVLQQPSQKLFESRLWAALRTLDPNRPTYVESESRKIGQRQVPEALIFRLRASSMIQIEADITARTRFLVQDYAHLCHSESGLTGQLQRLVGLHGHARVESWTALAREGAWAALVEALLINHYDPAYDRSITRNFKRLDQARRVVLPDLDASTLDQTAQQILRQDDS